MTVTSNIHIGVTAWAASQTITAGMGRTNSGNVYRATNSGTTATAGPTHTSGTVADGGGVNWKWLSAYDYSTMASWWASVPEPMVDNIVGLIWNHGEIVEPADFAFCFMLSSRTAGSFTTLLTPAAGEAFYDNMTAADPLYYTPSKGVAFKKTGFYGNVAAMRLPHVTLRGLQLYNAGAYDGVFDDFQNLPCTVDRCLAVTDWGGGGNAAILFTNCLVVYTSAGNTGIDFKYGPSGAVNCTFVVSSGVTPSGGTPFNAAYGTPLIRNTVALGFVNASGSSFSGDHNAFDNSTVVPSGTTSNITTVVNGTGTFVQPNHTLASPNFRLASGSALINAGTTDTTSIPTSIDIFGVTRSSWDIGCAEYVASGSSYSDSVTEASTAATSATAVLNAAATITEAGTAGTAQAATAVMSVAISEPATASTAQAATFTTSAAITEPSAITNYLLNGDGVGAVAGTPGTLPAPWNIVAANGLSQQVIGTGTEGGINYTEVRFFGTATGTVLHIAFSSTALCGSEMPAANGQTWTFSHYQRLTAGVSPTTINLAFGQANVSNVIGTSQLIPIAVPTSAALNTQRVSGTVTINVAGTTGIRSAQRLSLTNGAVYDFTVRYGGAMAELSPIASPTTLFTSGTPRSTPDDVATGSRGTAATISEAATAAEAPTAVLAAVATITEAANATDSSSALVALLAGITETASAGTVQAATAAMLGAITEASAATDAATGAGATLATVTEAAAAAAVQAATAAFTASIAEAATAGDAAAATSTTAGISSIIETATAADAATATLAAFVAFTEAVTAAATATAALATAATVTEAAAAADAATAALAALATMTEAATAADLATAALATLAAITEPATAADVATAARTTPASISEAATAGEASTATVARFATITEAANAAATATALAAAFVDITEAAAAAEASTASTGLFYSIVEAANAMDAAEIVNIIAPPSQRSRSTLVERDPRAIFISRDSRATLIEHDSRSTNEQ